MSQKVVNTSLASESFLCGLIEKLEINRKFAMCQAANSLDIFHGFCRLVLKPVYG